MKLKLEELRVGNWIQMNGLDKNNFFKVLEVGETMKCLDSYEKENGFWDIRDFSAIILTPEILVKCCFVKQNNGWTIGKKDDNDDSCFGLFDDNLCNGKLDLKLNGCYLPMPKVKTLHQLQNIYYALTGKELNYKP